MFCTADPASGSVMPMLMRASPSAAAGSQRSFMASGPRCWIPRGGPLKVSWQQMAEDTSARAISSSTMAASTSPKPMPPHASPMVMRSRSAPASALRTSAGTSPVSSPWEARGATSREATSRASWRSAAWSSFSASRSNPDAPAISPGPSVVVPSGVGPSLPELGADHAHEAHALSRGPAQVGGQSHGPARTDGGDLPVGRSLAAQLQPALEEHAQSRGADRVTETLEATIGVDGELAVAIEGPRQDFLPGCPPFGEPQVLHQHQLGGREAVMDLGHGQLPARIGDPGLGVGVGGRTDHLGERGVVVSWIDRTGGRAGHEAEGLDVQRVVAIRVGVLGPANDGGGRPVAHPAAVEDTELAGHQRGL